MVNRLLPCYQSASPPKEGRSHVYLSNPPYLRQSVSLRVLAVFFSVAAAVYFLQAFIAGEVSFPRRELSSKILTETHLLESLILNEPTQERESQPTADFDLTAQHDQKPIIQRELEPEMPKVEPLPPPPPPPPETKKIFKPKASGGRQSKLEEHPQFEASLDRVISLLPNEVNIRELLRPVKSTGKERLREMGLRTRAFKTYFEAWEDLHLVTDGDHTHIRDDVVQYLRSYHDSATVADTIRSYEAFRSFFQRLSYLLFPWIMPFWSDHMTLHTHFRNGGRGLVLSAGDQQAPYILTSIRTFRELGCTLPIEVMYLGDSDLDEDYRQNLEAMPGVVTRDMAPMVKDEGWKLKGWAGKPYAMLLSSFQEVIFIDADSLFFTDPAILFEDPTYVETGALFFRDRKIMPENKKRWLQQVLPKPISKQVKQSYMWTGESGHYQESGVVVVDKWRHLVALLLVTRMNGPDRDGKSDEGIQGVYEMVYGDKETYWLGWELAGDQGYAFHQGAAGIMGTIKPRKQKNSLTSKNKEKEKERVKENAHEKKNEKKEGSSDDEDYEDVSPIFELDPNAIPENYTICAPQLLHLTIEGKPLWFNGWIMANKFEDKKKEQYGTFDVYMTEPKEKIGDDDAWKLMKSNECCLTVEQILQFDENERETLNMIIRTAKEVRSNSDI